MIVHAPWLVKVITGNFAKAITLYPFILIRNKEDVNNPILINHEKIHLRQQQELLIIIFYLWYLVDYVAGRTSGMSHYQAYRHIIFEQEAFDNETNLQYLKNRKRGAYRSYMSS